MRRVHQGFEGRQLIRIQHESVNEIAALIQKCSQRDTKSIKRSRNILNENRMLVHNKQDSGETEMRQKGVSGVPHDGRWASIQLAADLCYSSEFSILKGK